MNAYEISDAIQWHEGLLLTPQHFQQLSARHEALVQYGTLIKDATEEWLPRTLVRNWTEAVVENLKPDPLSPNEYAFLGLADEPVAYGATLLAAAVTERFVLYLQLGDGDIFTV